MSVPEKSGRPSKNLMCLATKRLPFSGGRLYTYKYRYSFNTGFYMFLQGFYNVYQCFYSQHWTLHLHTAYTYKMIDGGQVLVTSEKTMRPSPTPRMPWTWIGKAFRTAASNSSRATMAPPTWRDLQDMRICYPEEKLLAGEWSWCVENDRVGEVNIDQPET